jgi:hypothetical protein
MSTNKKRERKPMKLEQMELAQARIDVMIGFLQRRVTEGAHRQEDIAGFQQWRNELDVQTGLERAKNGSEARSPA